MRRLVIVTAIELEARVLARELELPALCALPFPAFGGELVSIVPAGLHAGLLGERLPALLHGTDHPVVVSAGVCGGLAPALHAGDLVIPRSVLGPAGEMLNVTPSWHQRAMSLAPAGSHAGLLVTAAEVVTTAEAKASLHAATGAVAADLESSRILTAAAAAGCPSLVIRGVSDDASQALPSEIADLVSPEGRIRPARALRLAMTRPRVVPRARALDRSTRRALAAVARVLAGLAG